MEKCVDETAKEVTERKGREGGDEEYFLRFVEHDFNASFYVYNNNELQSVTKSLTCYNTSFMSE